MPIHCMLLAFAIAASAPATRAPAAPHATEATRRAVSAMLVEPLAMSRGQRGAYLSVVRAR